MATIENVNNARPNIRIEIKNNLVSSMEIDDNSDKLSDGEEGEIIDEAENFDALIENNITYPPRPQADQPKSWTGVSAEGFTTGIDIFDKEEQKKLSVRARRFALDPNEVVNFTEENLQSLHDSLGLSSENEKDVRFEALHMYGTSDMSSEDILHYFMKYAPAGIEWINDNCCNVVWQDKVSGARALFYLSKSVKGMPVGGSCDPLSTKKEGEEGRSVLLKNNNREVELEEEMEDDEVSIKDIKIPIPPGYWRLGVPHLKSEYVLLRFSLKSDMKPFRAERFSDYYKKHGSNFGGLKGIISESKKAQLRGIFDRNKEIDSKNPWGDLATTWNRDRRTEEIAKPVEELPQPNAKMQQRLGFKRSQTAAFDGAASEEKQEKVEKPPKSKVPRMRMYADEEEEKVRRKRQLAAIKSIASANAVEVKPEPKDLRNMIRNKDRPIATNVRDIQREIDVQSSEDEEEEEVEPPKQADLSDRLLNRRLKLAGNRDLEIKTNVRESVRDIARYEANMTKQSRFREELLRSKAVPFRKTPHPHNQREAQKDDYEEEDEEMYSDEDLKTNSKVTVVIKKQKQPTVASTVWSRVSQPSNKSSANRKQVSGRQIPRSKAERGRSSESSKSESSSSDSSTEEEEENEDQIKPSIVNRPGFRNDLSDFKSGDHKSPLRIEINNDHYSKK